MKELKKLEKMLKELEGIKGLSDLLNSIAEEDTPCDCENCEPETKKVCESIKGKDVDKDEGKNSVFNKLVEEVGEEVVNLIMKRLPEFEKLKPEAMNRSVNPDPLNYILSSTIRERQLTNKLNLDIVAYIAHRIWINNYNKEHKDA